MRQKGFSLLLIVIFLSAFWGTSGSAFDKPTHEAVNIEIAKRTIADFSLNNYLIKQLGFEKGIEEQLKVMTQEWVQTEEGPAVLLTFTDERNITGWIGHGGFQEDVPESIPRYITNTARNNNHFHNPLKPWNEAGFNLTNAIVGKSSIVWAQKVDQAPGGHWSWHDARNYFFNGLTSPDKKDRDSEMGKAFRALGQLMHLVQDSTVPAHTRNDWHRPYVVPNFGLEFQYETWLERIRLSEPQTFGRLTANPISFDPTILRGEVNDLAPIAIAKIVDTDTYHGDNPEVTSDNRLIGSAEYTSANFFGEHTIFNETIDHPFPNRACTEIAEYPIPDPRAPTGKVYRKYFKKIGRGEKDYRLATLGFLEDYITTYFKNYYGPQPVALDGGVYQDYAERLMPRAVGYAAGLLKYFFRGELDVIPTQDQSGMIQIRNLSSEDMVGTFTLYYDALDGTRNPVENGSWDLWLFAGLSSEPLRFTEPNPTEVLRPGHYFLVFKGKMGKICVDCPYEPDAVVGKMWCMDCCEKDELFREVILHYDDPDRRTLSPNQEKAFWVDPYEDGGCIPFNWELVGPGTLDVALDGLSAVYKAPDKIATCEQGGFLIRVRDKCGTLDQVPFQIANPTPYEEAYRVWGCYDWGGPNNGSWCNSRPDNSYLYHYLDAFSTFYDSYDCAGNLMGRRGLNNYLPCATHGGRTGGCCNVMGKGIHSHDCFGYSPETGCGPLNYGDKGCGHIDDVRTQQMKDGLCCPPDLYLKE